MQKIIIDTNVLMGCKNDEALFGKYKDKEILIEIGTMEELDRLKTAPGQKGYEARNAIRLLKRNKDKFKPVIDKELDLTKVDHKIISAAKGTDMTVITNDISMEILAGLHKVDVENYEDPSKVFSDGYHEIDLAPFSGANGLDFAKLSYYISENDIHPGEYIVGNLYGMPLMYRYTSQGIAQVTKEDKIVSKVFPAVRGKDQFQTCAIDSLIYDDITVLTGPAGSGKTLMALAYQFQLLERGEIDQITVFFNPTNAAGAEDMGFNKGDRTSKILQKSLGGILASKLGDEYAVEDYILSGTLKLIPIGDARGYEIPERSSLYITEAQNLTVELMQLAIQRASEGVKVIVEGDPTSQLDSWKYQGDNNGMLRLINTFKGFDGFGHVDLKNVYRSRIAERAELMTK